MKTSGTMNSATGHTSVSTRTGNFNDGLYDRAGARPDLDLDFARTKSLKDKVSKEDLITFTRSSGNTGYGATYVDENGLVKVATVNLLKHSEDSSNNSVWTKGNNTTINANVAVAPDGTNTANRIEMAATGSTFMYQLASLTVGETYTASVYVKSTGTSSNFNMLVFANGTYVAASYTNSQTTTQTEWTRYELTFTATNSSTQIGMNNLSDTWALDAYVWGWQVEKGSVATEYIPTTDQVSGAPRFTHDPVTKESKGLLIEQQATNLTYPSVPNQDGSGSGLWNGERTTRTYNAATAPDGTNTALLFTQDTTATTSHYVRANHMVTLTDNTDYTFSCFVKKPPTNGNRYVFIALHGRGYRHYDLQDGVLAFANDDGTASNLHGSITAYPNDWYKLTYTINTSSNNSVAGRIYIGHSANGNTHSFTGDGTSGLLVWGTQLEQGAFATSYIPTSGSTATRSADVASIEGDNFGTYRTNLVPNTSFRKNFDSYTITKGIHQNYAALSPSGKFDAAKLTADPNLNSNHRLWKFVTVQASQKYSVSAYVKAGTSSKCAIGLFDGSPATEATRFQVARIDLAANPPTISNTYNTHTFTNTSITDVGNGWYRAQFTSTAVPLSHSGAAGIIFLRDSSSSLTFAGNGESMFYWGLQVERADAPTEFIPSTDEFTSRSNPTATYVDGTGLIKTASANEARYSHDPETLTPTGLYLEPAATNLSAPNVFDFAADLGVRQHYNTIAEQKAGQNTDGVVSPDGTAVGVGRMYYTGTETDPSTDGYVSARDNTVSPHALTTFPNNNIYTSSVFIKPGLETEWRLRAQDAYASASAGGTGESIICNYLLTGNGTISNLDSDAVDATVQKYPNGWYRCSITYYRNSVNAVTTTQAVRIYATSYKNYNANNRTGTVGWFWGPQVEEGSTVTSYIPTSGAEATRSADIFTSTATEVLDRANGTKPAFYTKSGISFFTQGTYTKDNLARRFFEFKGNNASQFSLTSTSNLANPKMGLYQQNATLTDSSGNNYLSGLGASASAPAGNTTSDDKFAARFEFNNSRLFTNGTGGNLDQTCDLRSSTELYIGNWHNADPASHRFLSGTIQRLTFWKTPFPDNKLDRLTS